MKKTIALCTAAMMLLCSFSLKNLFGSKSTTTTPAATTTTTINNDGQSAGKALRGLYTQYKADGKFDYSNINNIINTVSLVNSCQNLKTNIKDSDYWKSFAAGLVIGSESLVTDELSGTVTEQLNDLVQNINSEQLNKVTTQAATVKSAADNISSLMSLFQ